MARTRDARLDGRSVTRRNDIQVTRVCVQKCARRRSRAGCSRSTRDLGEVRNRQRRGTDLGEQREPVRAQRLVVRVDDHRVEERIDRRAQLREGAHRAGEVFDVDRSDGVGRHLLDRRVQRFFLRQLQEFPIGLGCRVAGLVLLLLVTKDVRRALHAGEQHRAVIRLQELAERLDALHDQREVVLPAKRKHRIDQIVPRTLVAQVHLQPIGEEGEAVSYTHLDVYKRQASTGARNSARARIAPAKFSTLIAATVSAATFWIAACSAFSCGSCRSFPSALAAA